MAPSPPRAEPTRAGRAADGAAPDSQARELSATVGADGGAAPGRAGCTRRARPPPWRDPRLPPHPPAAPALRRHPPQRRRAGRRRPGSRPVNPFLSQDPALKARRLARALISDMVVYHPAKRQEGLRDGTLKELFEDEIRKSWEEYADQVGKDVADGTPYFKEALNEILAGGRQIF